MTTSNIYHEISDLVAQLSFQYICNGQDNDTFYRVTYTGGEAVLEMCFLNAREEYTAIYVYSNPDVKIFKTVLEGMLDEARQNGPVRMI